MAKDLRPAKKIEKARAGLVMDSPFWAAIALKLEMIEDKNGEITKTMATNGKSIYWYPPFVDELTLNQVKGVLAHEVGHCVLLHPFRRGTREPQDWNIAADFATNPILIEAGFELTEGALIDAIYKNKETEAIYTLIQKLKKDQPKQESPGKGKGKDNAPDPKCPDPGNMGGVMDYPGTPADKAIGEEEQKMVNVQAAQIARKQGKLPGGLERLIGELNEPSVNWKEALAMFVDCNSRNDYAFDRPNRKFLAMGIYLPALNSPELGHVIIHCDASGSVSPDELRDMASEAAGILEMYQGVALSIVFFDTTASKIFHVTDETDIKGMKIPRKGGGTDYRPSFKAVEKAGINARCHVVLTDGYCSDFPKSGPDGGVLWVINNKEMGRSFKPPFGDVLTMPRAEK